MAYCKNWCWTLNNFTADERAAIDGASVTYIVYGEEVGDEGTPHLQGFVQLTKKMRLKSVKTLLGDRLHLEKMKGTVDQAVTYCQKDGKVTERGKKVVGGARTDLRTMHMAIVDGSSHMDMIEKWGDRYIRAKRSIDAAVKTTRTEVNIKRLRASMEEGTLNEWQKEVWSELGTQTERTILFVVDDVGNTGKTWFAKWLVGVHGAFYTNTTEYNDVMYAYDSEPYVVFDLARSAGKINYGTLEAMKNGICFIKKYESRQKIFPPPTVVVMTNDLDIDPKLSSDRIRRFYISNKPDKMHVTIVDGVIVDDE